MTWPAGTARLAADYRAARYRLCPPDQIANAPDANYDLSGDDDAAAAVSAHWDVFIPGKPIPLIWERVEPEWYCEPI